MRMTKKILAIMISAVMLLGLLAGCDQGATPNQTNPQEETAGSPRTDGMLVFSSDASLNVTYDEEGQVISIEGINAEGISLAEEYTDFPGKSCAAVVKDLVTASIDNDYLTNNIVIKQAVGSALPDASFLDTIASEAQAAADAADAVVTVILIAEEDLDDNGYIGLTAAKKILMSHLGIVTTSTFDGDPTPLDGTYTFHLVAEKVEGYFTVDAVNGIASELSDADNQTQEDTENETTPQNGDLPADVPAPSEEFPVESSPTAPENIEDTASTEESTSADINDVTIPAEETIADA